jgi:IstB-like ATP binding protein
MPIMAGALIDRLMHHCHVVNIRGNSYRMREHTDLWHAISSKNEDQTNTSYAGSEKRRRRRTEDRHLAQSVQFSPATNEQFSPGVDSWN